MLQRKKWHFYSRYANPARIQRHTSRIEPIPGSYKRIAHVIRARLRSRPLRESPLERAEGVEEGDDSVRDLAVLWWGLGDLYGLHVVLRDGRHVCMSAHIRRKRSRVHV